MRQRLAALQHRPFSRPVQSPSPQQTAIGPATCGRPAKSEESSMWPYTTEEMDFLSEPRPV